MSEELKQAFDVLDVNTKRNQISNELIVIYELIRKFELSKNVNSITNVKNYDSINDKNMSESDMLTFFYEDIYNIQQELISLLNLF